MKHVCQPANPTVASEPQLFVLCPTLTSYNVHDVNIRGDGPSNTGTCRFLDNDLSHLVLHPFRSSHLTPSHYQRLQPFHRLTLTLVLWGHPLSCDPPPCPHPQQCSDPRSCAFYGLRERHGHMGPEVQPKLQNCVLVLWLYPPSGRGGFSLHTGETVTYRGSIYLIRRTLRRSNSSDLAPRGPKLIALSAFRCPSCPFLLSRRRSHIV